MKKIIFTSMFAGLLALSSSAFAGAGGYLVAGELAAKIIGLLEENPDKSCLNVNLIIGNNLEASNALLSASQESDGAVVLIDNTLCLRSDATTTDVMNFSVVVANDVNAKHLKCIASGGSQCSAILIKQ